MLHRLTFKTEDVPRKLDDGDLEAEADTQVGNLLLPGPFSRSDHTLSSAKSETTGHEDTAGIVAAQHQLAEREHLMRGEARLTWQCRRLAKRRGTLEVALVERPLRDPTPRPR